MKLLIAVLIAVLFLASPVIFYYACGLTKKSLDKQERVQKRSRRIFRIYIIACILCIVISIIIEIYIRRVLFPMTHPVCIPMPYNTIINICDKLLMFGSFPFVIIGIFLYGFAASGTLPVTNISKKEQQLKAIYDRAIERNFNARTNGNAKEIARTEKEVAQAYGALIAERHGTQKNLDAYNKAVNNYYSSKITNKSDKAKAIDEANIMREFGKL